jgi:hypothetical protein
MSAKQVLDACWTSTLKDKAGAWSACRPEIVAGAAGTGKTFYADKKLALANCNRLVRVPIHEGFNVQNIISQYGQVVSSALADATDAVNRVGLHIDVFEQANLCRLSDFLYELLACGLMKDLTSGSACCVHASVVLCIVVELPALAALDRPFREQWPADNMKVGTQSHPMWNDISLLSLLACPCHAVIPGKAKLELESSVATAAVGLGLLNALNGDASIEAFKHAAEGMKNRNQVAGLYELRCLGQPLSEAFQKALASCDELGPIRRTAPTLDSITMGTLKAFSQAFSMRVKYLTRIADAIGAAHPDGEQPGGIWFWATSMESWDMRSRVALHTNLHIGNFWAFILRCMVLECAQAVGILGADEERILTVRPGQQVGNFRVAISHGASSDGQKTNLPPTIFGVPSSHPVFLDIDECIDPTRHDLRQLRGAVAPGLNTFRSDQLASLLRRELRSVDSVSIQIAQPARYMRNEAAAGSCWRHRRGEELFAAHLLSHKKQ